MFSACDVAKKLEDFIPEFIQLEHRSNIWKVKETSATDIVISAFCHWSNFQVNVDASNELVTGADFEVLFWFPSGKTLTFFIQGKRSDYSSNPKKVLIKRWSYKELFHKNLNGLQITQILNCCSSPDRIPVYAFFHSRDSQHDLGLSATGIQLIHASFIKPATAPKRNILSTRHYAPNSFPFHKIFCLAETFWNDADMFSREVAMITSESDISPKQLSSEDKIAWLSFSDKRDGFRSSVRVVYSVPERLVRAED